MDTMTVRSQVTNNSHVSCCNTNVCDHQNTKQQTNW